MHYTYIVYGEAKKYKIGKIRRQSWRLSQSSPMVIASLLVDYCLLFLVLKISTIDSSIRVIDVKMRSTYVVHPAFDCKEISQSNLNIMTSQTFACLETGAVTEVHLSYHGSPSKSRDSSFNLCTWNFKRIFPFPFVCFTQSCTILKMTIFGTMIAVLKFNVVV